MRKRCGVTNLAEGFKRDVRAAATLPADTEALLVRSCTEALAMAAKAGQVVAGFAKVEGLLEQGRADGPDPRFRRRDRRNPQIGRDRRGKGPEISVNREFTDRYRFNLGQQLDLALGRSNVIHAALLAGPASKTFLSRCQTLVRYRMADDDKTGAAARNSDGPRDLIRDRPASMTVRTRTT